MRKLTCPNCRAALVEYDRDGVIVDVCPECRGVWLDRGELEKIVAMAREAVRADRAVPPPYRDEPGFGGWARDRRDGDASRDRWDDFTRRNRRKGTLERLMDIFD